MAIPANMKNPNLGMQRMSDYKWGEKGIPTRENCDLNNPKEMFLWMFTAMPGVNGAALMLPPDFWMLVSEHLYELGGRVVADPIKKYRLPTSNDPHWATSPGQWVPVDAPDEPVDPAARAWGRLSHIQKAEIRLIAYAWQDSTALPYSAESPSRIVWETLTDSQKAEIHALAKAEHEGEPG